MLEIEQLILEQGPEVAVKRYTAVKQQVIRGASHEKALEEVERQASAWVDKHCG